MARFYNTAQSGRSPVPRTMTGDPQGGMQSHTRGWELGIQVVAEAEEECDTFRVFVTRGSNAAPDAPTFLVAEIREASMGRWGLDPSRGGWLGDAVNLLRRLTHPAADDQDLEDARIYLDALPTIPSEEDDS